MTQTYKATGINLKGMPLGEADRLVTILTPEFGIVRAVAPGARKHKSRLGGRTQLFVVNELLIVKGRSLDRIIQAETICTYPALSQNLGKLAASQYLAELVLTLAPFEQPQPELYELLCEHLRRIGELSAERNIFAHIAQAVFHFLASAGVAPQVHLCCQTQKAIAADFTDPNWRVGFSFDSGGIVNLSAPEEQFLTQRNLKDRGDRLEFTTTKLPIERQLNAVELTLLQQLATNSLPETEPIFPQKNLGLSLELAWLRLEQILREYAQYYCGRLLRSASLIDAIEPREF